MASVPEETIVYEYDNSQTRNDKGYFSNASLRLTDLNIYIYIHSEWTGKIKETKIIPLNTINIIRGEVQVFKKTTDLLGLDNYLEINSAYGSYEFKMTGIEIERWINYIIKRVPELCNVANNDLYANDVEFDYSSDIEPANGSVPITAEEKIIFECDDATTINEKGYYIRVRLKLTDLNIYIYIPSEWTGKIKDTKVVPLNTINTIKGKVQVFTRTEFLGFDHYLKINTSYDSYEFKMNQRDVDRWSGYICSRVPELCNEGRLRKIGKTHLGASSANIDAAIQSANHAPEEKMVYKYSPAVVRAEKLLEKGVELKLTDQNLYMYFPSFWTGKPKEVRVIPLNTIKVLNGEPQVFIKLESFDYYLEIHADINSYSINMKKEDMDRWADYISERRIKLYKDEKQKYQKQASEEASPKRPGYLQDVFTDTKNKEYNTNGYVIKFDKNINHNSWKVYDNEGECIYKVKRAMVAMRPCLKIYDNREKQYVAEIKKHIDVLPHYHDSFVWVKHGETLGIVTLKLTTKPFKCNYNAGFIGWTYGVGLTKHYEIQGGERIIAKPISTIGADPEPFEYYDLNDELEIVMMFYTNYLDTHEQRTSLTDRILGG